MLIIHKRKKSLQDLDEADENISKYQNNYNIYNQDNKKNYSLNKINTTSLNTNNKYTSKKIRIKSPQVNLQPNTKYNSITFNHIHISSNNLKNIEENKSKRKNEVILQKTKDLYKYHYNLSNVNANINNSKTIEKPVCLYSNLKSLKSNKIKLRNINLENNNKYSIDEELTNQKYDNHQTKSTKISKLKILQKDKSQEQLKKKLFINEPVNKNNKNHNSVYYSNTSKTMSFDDKKDEDKKYNNHKVYEYAISNKRNTKNSTINKINKSVTNNLTLQNKRSYSYHK